MGDMREYFDAHKAQVKEKKAENLQSNLEFLNSMNIDYDVHNGGNQLNITFGTREIVAFYPTTNKWVWRGKTYNGDAKRLWDWIGEREDNERK